MNIQIMTFHSYEIPLTLGSIRSGSLVNIIDKEGNSGWGEIAPLPKWSKETLDEALHQVTSKKQDILKIKWTAQNCLKELADLMLYPSVSFGLESALLSILTPLPTCTVPTSALLMGSSQGILEQARLRQAEGFTTAKLKVGHLSFEEASHVIHELKDKFRLRIDVNRAWNTTDSLHFFSQFSKETFDYVEEPFENPKELALFPHPLAVDESFPQDLSLEELEALPTLKALIYKPTIQGGLQNCLSLHKWATKRGISLVLSSSFESDIGLAHVAFIARSLSPSPPPVGIGTYHYLTTHLRPNPLLFSQANVHLP